ncbi:tRNA (adenosine(37)-N6)-threonylcarbamoyltransferase complex ATPase subunit type 1 TsaE [Desulfonatronum sp. SC1]|uniref:tRNA (adenosine(37)-N6)-threonylcarbamoyltransferase complex ATPase subunit type 1 TsaE n=1 Tax=Desulfonatronum sp. SC1 TaxID=2109626 RepID=UPI000D2F8025|nr:tRNA (adenosine(37)-N6)-threonylcarbamoyltransferase complex ATPase subunit type 1 TsaE [Desulfonatronum sp. SC1]PTN38331.1 tRNA (adenosine(37)-N6)-threonylcarbamoyltransferase complex ATPase subunit type 1 TsaE [Desulfonatronum sp. SC1]
MPSPSTPLHLYLKDSDATIALGVSFVEVMRALGVYPALLLDGELGAGKTTFTRGAVQALPGGDEAEVASPSFNYLNVYPTEPETYHFDFYRLQGRGVDDELFCALHEPARLIIAEWTAYCRPDDLPADHLGVRFSVVPDGRQAAVQAHGTMAEAVLRRLRDLLPTHYFFHDALQGGDPRCGS